MTGGDMNRGAVANSDMMMNRIGIKTVKDTGVLREVGGGTNVKDPLHGV
jgi:hypothetical protein